MKNVIITGATSFIGINLISELMEHDFNITAIVRPQSEKKNRLNVFSGIKIVELEMNQYKNVNDFHFNIKIIIMFNN